MVAPKGRTLLLNINDRLIEFTSNAEAAPKQDWECVREIQKEVDRPIEQRNTILAAKEDEE